MTDIFQFNPPLVYYKLIESKLDLVTDLIYSLSQVENAKYGDVLKEMVYQNHSDKITVDPSRA